MQKIEIVFIVLRVNMNINMFWHAMRIIYIIMRTDVDSVKVIWVKRTSFADELSSVMLFSFSMMMYLFIGFKNYAQVWSEKCTSMENLYLFTCETESHTTHNNTKCEWFVRFFSVWMENFFSCMIIIAWNIGD